VIESIFRNKNSCVIEMPDEKTSKMTINPEEQMSRFIQIVTNHSTFLLMVAVIAFFLTNLFGFYTDFSTGNTNGYILGNAGFGVNNILNFVNFGALFALFNALLMALVNLCAGLSFAAVCFDESKNIYFRVVAVAALMLIIFGGLNIM